MAKHRVKPLTNLASSEDILRIDTIKERLSFLKTEFNLFFFFENIFNELEWTRIFSFLLSSKQTHSLGVNFFIDWINVVAANNKTVAAFIKKINFKKIKSVKTTTEWSTQNGDRLDLLIELINNEGRIIGVVGLENKVNSGEQIEQVSRYQNEMVRVFKEPEKIILFCTPDGRKSLTAANIKDCPCAEIDYSSFKNVCDKYRTATSGEVLLIMESLSKFLEKMLLQLELEKINNKINSKLGNPAQKTDYSDSIILFNKFHDMVYEKNFKAPYINEFYFRSWGRWAMEFWIREKKCYIDGELFIPAYLFEFQSKEPHVGDKYIIRFMLYWEKVYRKPKEIKNAIVNEVVDFFAIPDNRNKGRHFSRWINIWCSETFIVEDMGARDLQTFEEQLIIAIEKTYPLFLKKFETFKQKYN